MSETYTYLMSDFPYNKADAGRLTSEVYSEDNITTALKYITVTSIDCKIVFKSELSSPEETTLSGIVSSHSGEPLPFVEPPKMEDGRPIVRSDTRPLDTSTYFTMAGDSASGIGDGVELRWDFSDPSYTVISGAATLSNGFEIPEGYKAIVFDLYFLDPVYFKDGTIYHFDSPWGQYCCMDINVPAGGYYPNDYGNIPASALGLSGSQMYSYTATDQIYYRYVNMHYMYGDCPMGDELNAEGCMVDALPVGWFVRGIIITPNSDNVSKGFAEYEMYRSRSIILPGDTP
jgi:hypothetical protein